MYLNFLPIAGVAGKSYSEFGLRVVLGSCKGEKNTPSSKSGVSFLEGALGRSIVRKSELRSSICPLRFSL